MLYKRLLLLALLPGYFAFKMLPMSYSVALGGLGDYKFLSPVLVSMALWIADENDTVEVRINSGGGYVYKLEHLLAARYASKAKTIKCINMGWTASSAAVFSSVCDEQDAVLKSAYLFHRPFYMEGGEKVLVPVEYDTVVTPVLMETAFRYFTDEEKDLYISGGDVIIKGYDWIHRISN